jgi:Lipase (class 3)
MHLIQPTGHSLGGALATLAAYDIAAALESIGLPKMSLSVRFIPKCVCCAYRYPHSDVLSVTVARSWTAISQVVAWDITTRSR